MKFFSVVLLLVGILFIVNLAGYNTSITGGIMDKLGLVDSSGDITISLFKSSSGFSQLIAVLGLFSLGAGIVLGAFGRAPDIRYGTAGFVLLLVGYITADIVSLFLKLQSFGVTWMTNIGILLFGGMLITLYISAISYWQGSDG